MPPPGHHHVPGAHDPHGDVVDDGCPQVHEQFAGQEDEWRHELRVRILKKFATKQSDSFSLVLPSFGHY